MKKNIFTFFAIVLVSCSLACNGLIAPVNAAPDNTKTEDNEKSSMEANQNWGGTCNDGGFLGFLPWYHGLPLDSNCNVQLQGSSVDDGTNKIASLVWIIVANVLVDLFTAIGYLATGFIIYGGYLYIMSDGDPSKAAKAQKTLISAVIGIVIAVLANLIIRTIMTIIGA